MHSILASTCIVAQDEGPGSMLLCSRQSGHTTDPWQASPGERAHAGSWETVDGRIDGVQTGANGMHARWASLRVVGVSAWRPVGTES